MTTESNPRYDEVPYQSHPFLRSHPRWLATIGAVFGMTAPAPDRARVLELGCASGGNLIPMAESLPDSQCVGVDLSSRQIQDGQRFRQASGLSNVELKQASILDIDESYGQFDYIICHGVYSWVPRNVQQRILEICGKLLTPQGLAYVSYNTLPGWGMLGVLRDMMRFHASRFTEPSRQIAQSKALLNVLAKLVPSEDNPYGMLLKQSSQKLRDAADWYIYHEHLEENNDPVYFHEFVTRAGMAGLQFLGEADLLSMLTNRLPPEVQAALKEVSTNIVHSEQYVDFFRNRTFRETILCRRSVALNRVIDAEKIKPLSFATDLEAQASPVDVRNPGEVTFSAPQRPSVGVSDPIFKAALVALRAAWPRYVPVLELQAQVRGRLELAPASEQNTREFIDRLWSWYTNHLVQMTSTPVHCANSASERPVASAVARGQLSLGRTLLTDLLHRPVRLSAFEAAVLQRLDGSHDRAALSQALAGNRAVQELLAKEGRSLDASVQTALNRFAGLALLKS
ncbi:MAG TPA: class I SAM-dependent methyltransferase [Polyangiaceae bacterium]|nr:class I SAM-dependent methyltransferase [Polyangiaceae bacterium]